jgi:hypothetical protein
MQTFTTVKIQTAVLCTETAHKMCAIILEHAHASKHMYMRTYTHTQSMYDR